MDIGKSVTFAFEDKDWLTKLLIGGVVNLVPIVNLAAVGYQLQTLRNVAAGQERPLPDWDDFGNYFVRGLIVLVAGVIYALPLFLLVAVATILSVVSGSSSNDAAGVIAICWVGFGCLATLYGILLSLWLPAAMVLYAMSNQFGAFFRFGEIWKFISRNVGGYIIVLLVSWVASLVASSVGAIVLVIGTAFTSFWAMLLSGHLLGQLARENGLTPA